MAHSRLRDRFDGAGPFVAGAVGLAVLGLLAVFAVLQSPTHLLWTGERVHGQEHGGIVYYSYGGRSYTVDGPGGATASGPQTVWLDRGNPQDAMVENVVDRAVDAAVVLVLFGGAAGLVVAGLLRGPRRARRARRQVLERPGDTFGQGIDPEFVNRWRSRRR